MSDMLQLVGELFVPLADKLKHIGQVTEHL